MITPILLKTARPGIPGLTFYAYQDVSALLWRMEAEDSRWMAAHDKRAGDRLSAVMAAISGRDLQPGSVRRQYLIPLVAVDRARLRALHDHETRSGQVTHFRVIWFAEAELTRT